MFDRNTWNHLTVCKKQWAQIKNVTCKLFIYKSYILIYIYKQDLALNNLQGLICHQTKQNQIKFFAQNSVLHLLYRFTPPPPLQIYQYATGSPKHIQLTLIRIGYDKRLCQSTTIIMSCLSIIIQMVYVIFLWDKNNTHIWIVQILLIKAYMNSQSIAPSWNSTDE